MIPRVLRIATRASALAQWQAEWVGQQLARTGHPIELVLLSSQGDLDQRPITDASGRGLFTKRIQRALLDDEADIAVHSLKDLPTEQVVELRLAAVPPRESVRDCLVTRDGRALEQLPAGAVVGTGSRRRQAQLLHRRHDLQVRSIRGNVGTRLGKLDDGRFDALVLAEAGLRRLELAHRADQPLPLDWMLPAPGQGALGIEVRDTDNEAATAAATLDDPKTRYAVAAERALLRTLEGGCLAPIAAYGQVAEGRVQLAASILAFDGSERLDGSRSGPAEEAERVGHELGEELRRRGAVELLVAAREAGPDDESAAGG